MREERNYFSQPGGKIINILILKFYDYTVIYYSRSWYNILNYRIMYTSKVMIKYV